MTTLATWPGDHRVWCGCFTGRVDEFAAREEVVMDWDDPTTVLWEEATTPWDTVSIHESCPNGWVVYACVTWPTGEESKELIWWFTLPGVLDAIRQRGPYVGHVIWRRPKGGE